MIHACAAADRGEVPVGAQNTNTITAPITGTATDGVAAPVVTARRGVVGHARVVATSARRCSWC